MYLVFIVWLAGVGATIIHQLVTEITVTEANKNHSVVHYYKGLPDKSQKRIFIFAIFLGLVLWFFCIYRLLFPNKKSPSD